MRFVFDVDDTICIHNDRDYINAVPIQDMIDIINNLYNNGHHISLYTARGQNSCKGDIDLIKEKNQDILLQWLEKHNVHFNELIFGKPLGDFYVDDKAVDLPTFRQLKIEQLKGGSGCIVTKFGNTVVKEGQDKIQAERIKREYEWYKKINKLGYNITPNVTSFVVNKLYMEYIDGELLCNRCTRTDIKNVINLMSPLKRHYNINYNFDDYIDNLLSHLRSIDQNIYMRIFCVTDKVINKLSDMEREIYFSNCFAHGDLSLSNIIKRKEGGYCLIDPNYKDDYSSVILDYAKLRFSLNGYEYMFGLTKNKSSKRLLKYFDKQLIKNCENLELIKLLEITHWMRLFKYKDEQYHKMIADKILELWRTK